MKTKRNRQAGPAIALAQLISEFPHLQPLPWTLSADGLLMASSLRMEQDPRPLMAEYVEVLGGRPSESRHEVKPGDARFSSWLHVTWRDVELSIWMGCEVSLAPVEPEPVDAYTATPEVHAEMRTALRGYFAGEQLGGVA